MRDDELLELGRRAREGDPLAVFRWRSALVRAGRLDEAGLRVGDVCESIPARDEEGLTVPPQRVLLTREDDGRWHHRGVDQVSIGLAFTARAFVLVEPFDPSRARCLFEPWSTKTLKPTKSRVRLKLRRAVARILSETWCLGASAEITRAYLRFSAPTGTRPNLQWLRDTYWSEVWSLTGCWSSDGSEVGPRERQRELLA